MWFYFFELRSIKSFIENMNSEYFFNKALSRFPGKIFFYQILNKQDILNKFIL